MIPTSASAKRYALLVGANYGASGDEPLRFATTDAIRFADTLLRLGGFDPSNVLVLENPKAGQLRQVLLGINSRVTVGHPDDPGTVLLVYYSGHADENSLHLGDTSLSWRELREMTASSTATARLLIVDACRSGHATRVKGARLDTPFALPGVDDRVPEGFAILSSAAAGESAQESDTLEGSFFSHHLLAAMAGAGDGNFDGRVTLSEAYQYAADRTVASTSQTMAGTQHPTFLFELKGRRELTLTRHQEAQDSGRLVLSDRGQYLIRAGDEQGPLVLEVSVADEKRELWLPANRYLVQQRLPTRMYEYQVSLRVGEAAILNTTTRRTVDYVQLAQKGTGSESRVMVLPIKSGLPAVIREALDASLGLYLGAYASHTVVTVDDINSQIGAERLKDAAGCNDVWCATELAGAAGAQYLLAPVAHSLGSHFLVTLSLIDITGAQATKRAQAKTPDQVERYEQALDLAARRLFDVKAGTESAVTPLTTSLAEVPVAPAEPLTEAPAQDEDDGPIYTTWWFWTIVTGVVAAATTTTFIFLDLNGAFYNPGPLVFIYTPEPTVLLD